MGRQICGAHTEEYRGQVKEAMAQLPETQAGMEAALQELSRKCKSLACEFEKIAYIML